MLELVQSRTAKFFYSIFAAIINWCDLNTFPELIHPESLFHMTLLSCKEQLPILAHLYNPLAYQICIFALCHADYFTQFVRHLHHLWLL